MGGKGSGRYKGLSSKNINDLTDLSLEVIFHALKSPKISDLDKAKLAQPLIVRRIPDRQEQVQLSINVDTETVKRIASLAERNLLIYKNLEADREEGRAVPVSH